MPYKLKFTDPSKPNTITVPDFPPGLNTIDTSLSFVGRAYPNYGQKTAENFLHLLENFAGPTPPANPIEGQLWYDTSDPNNKVLRVNDGTATSTWPAANGIFQQATDPAIGADARVKIGDIWVDTEKNLLKIFSSAGEWSSIGATTTLESKTGSEPVEVTDLDGNAKNIIKLWSQGDVVAIVSSNATFTPLSVIEGFDEIVPGITLSKKSGVTWKFQGLAENSVKLNGLTSTSYLRKDDSSNNQQITGRVTFVTPNDTSPEGRDGVVVRVASTNLSDFIQFYKQGDDAVLANNTLGGKILLKTKGTNDSVYSNTAIVEKNQITINGSLSINGDVSISGELLNLEQTGMIKLWGGSNLNVPSGWLLCNGDFVSKITYSALFNVIGERYGIANVTNFYLPNLSITTTGPNNQSITTYYIIKT